MSLLGSPGAPLINAELKQSERQKSVRVKRDKKEKVANALRIKTKNYTSKTTSKKIK